MKAYKSYTPADLSPVPEVKKRLPRVVYIIICVLPCVLTTAFYALRGSFQFMDDAALAFARPVRSFFGLMNSLYPFSIAEVLCVLAAVWVVYHIVKTIVVTIRSEQKFRKLLIRLLALVTAALYVWCAFCWLWGSAYFETSFAAKNGFTAPGVTHDELLRTARFFLDKANDLAPQIPRDSNGHFSTDSRTILRSYDVLYLNTPFSGLDDVRFAPKPVFFSKLMSRTGFTGFYFAFTGEANVNTDAPACLLPATVAHELAHQKGIAAEEEANFLAIYACISSDDLLFEYSGYLMGLIHLSNALYTSDSSSWSELRLGFCPELERDWTYNNEYWQKQNSDSGIGEAVTAFYDGYLKLNGQQLGVRSYGACVDLLVEWFIAKR